MTLDPRTPVIVGVGQHSRRVDRGEEPLEPADMMVVAARAALADTKADVDPAELDAVRTVGLISWRYRDAAALVAERLGVGHPVATGVTTWAGSSPQMLVNRSALDIQAGDVSCVLLAGAESWRTRTQLRRAGEKPEWTEQGDDVPEAPMIGEELDMSHPAELAVGIGMPIQVYPLFEQALRHRLGRSREEHLAALGELWSRFSEVAAGNPHAWVQEAMTPEQVTTPSPGNRQVSLPYTKVMNSNEQVEQSAAVLLCSVEVAERLGIPRERWVFPLSGADANEHTYVSHRERLDTAPAVGIAGRAALAGAGLTIDDVDHVDLYSCFPVAVEVGAEQLGLPLDRQLTQTGGLHFAGGPWNDYVMHAIATMVDVLRGDPGTTGLVWGNGGLLTKHSIGLYSTEPPAAGFAHAHPQAEVDALPRREVSADVEGPVTVETYTVLFGRDGGPERAIFALLTDDGVRCWGASEDLDVMVRATAEDLMGATVTRSAEGVVTL